MIDGTPVKDKNVKERPKIIHSLGRKKLTVLMSYDGIHVHLLK